MTVNPSKTARRVHASTHIFNFRLFIEGLKCLRIAGIAVAILALTVSALIPTATWLDIAKQGFDEYEMLVVSPAYLCVPAGVMVLISPIFAATLFDFLFKRRDSDFFHAIPYTRTCVYISFVAATVTAIAAIITGCGLVSGILWMLCPYATMDIGALCAYVSLCIFAAVMLSGFMLLAMTVTGTGGTAVLLFALFASLVRIIAAILLCMMESIQLLETNTMWYTSLLSPFWFLPLSAPTLLFEMSFVGSGVGDIMYTPANILYSLVVTLAVYALAGVLYVRRRSEMAGNPAPGRKSQALFRILFALPFALILPLCLWDRTDFTFILVVLVVTLLVYFLYELITTKRARNMLKAVPGLIILAAATLLFTGVFFGVRVYVLNESIPASDMESVQFGGEWNGLWPYSETVLQGTSFDDPAILATVADCLADSQRFERAEGIYLADDSRRATVSIRLRGGRVIVRDILMNDDSYRAILAAMAKDEAYRATVLELPPAEDLRHIDLDVYSASLQMSDATWDHNTPEFDTLYRVFAEEYRALSDEEKIAHMVLEPMYIRHEGEDLRFYLCMYGWTSVGYNEYTYNYMNYYLIDASFPRTYAAFVALWSQHDRGGLSYPIRHDLTDKAAVLADISAYFSDDGRMPVEDFPLDGRFITTLTVYSADGRWLFEEANTLRADGLVPIADRLAALLTVVTDTDASAFELTEDTCIIRLRFSQADEAYYTDVDLWLICEANAEDREALRKAMW